ncbi:hypothetical protein FRC12_009841 [Ceratobasidium sp. 428]|nr:hypothetical protein FRC12_009841 [Ceratobasidium sp. 428]
MAFDVSANGRWLFSTTDDGDFTVLSTNGYVHFRVGMGVPHMVTSATWVGDRQIALGCVDGAIYMATFSTEPHPTEKTVRITEIVHDNTSIVHALAYDAGSKLLAVRYENCVAVWRQVPGKHALTWTIVDSCLIQPNRTRVSIKLLHFFGPDARLLIGSELGFMTWSLKAGLTRLDIRDKVSDVASSAVSFDGSMLAVSAPDYLVTTWSLSHQGPCNPVSYEHSLRSAGEWHPFTPRAPIAFTCDEYIVYGTYDRTIIIMGQGGELIEILTCAAHIRAIVARGDMIYASLNDAYGVVTTVAYSNKKSRQNEFNDSETKPTTSTSKQVPTFYRLDEVFEAPSYSRGQSQCMVYIICPVIIFFAMWLVRGRSVEGRA